ncbi:barstar family protein [Streptomyces sp. NBC_01281]|uniref:barstar family protein n=1 Tax=unclassified Streptomyces TaxID=2593676 RepID=UPI0013B7A83B|nr:MULTISPECIES: barstar family protein [unclassified Streptomyces]NEB34260.1 barstar family protein [Streptomyces sp. SID14446]WSK60562.1 barstar family protein [Streptomyces sp. NBC_01281]
MTGSFAIVAHEEVPAIVDAAGGRDIPVLALSTAGRVDRSSFFSAVRDSLPLDPPLETSRSWDALADSLWEGLHTMPASQLVVLWTDAGPPEAGQEQDFQHALWILRDLVDTLADSQLTVGAPTELTVRVAVDTQTQPLAQRLLHQQ